MNTPSSREERLREEVVLLREELRRLTLRVDRQADQLDHLELLSEHSERGSFNSSFLSEVPTARGGSEPAAAPSNQSLGSYSVVEGTGAVSETGPVYSWVFREQVARGIGEFLARSLAGENRGNSGRDRLRGLQSRHYLVIRDYDGVITTHPVRVLNTFTAVKELRKRPSTGGDGPGAVHLQERRVWCSRTIWRKFRCEAGETGEDYRSYPEELGEPGWSEGGRTEGTAPTKAKSYQFPWRSRGCEDERPRPECGKVCPRCRCPQPTLGGDEQDTGGKTEEDGRSSEEGQPKEGQSPGRRGGFGRGAGRAGAGRSRRGPAFQESLVWKGPYWS